MTKKEYSWSMVLFLCVSMLQGQALKSEKTYLQINDESAVSEREILKSNIEIYSPKFDSQSRFETSESEISILGAITHNNIIISAVVNSVYVDLTESGQFAQQLELFPGENTVIVGALDKNNNYTEKRFIVNYTPIKISLAEKIHSESKYFAVIIGINNYSDPAINSLDNPLLDAQRFYDVLTTKYTFDKSNIQLLKDAKREEIIYAFDYLTRVVTENDNLLIFYAGHGNFDNDANIGYWLPSNAKKITTADWFGNSQLVDFIKKIDTKHTLLIADACFSGSIFKHRGAFANAPLAIEKLYELPSRKAMTSGTLTTVPDRSSFAKYLIDRLEYNEEQYYSAEQLYSNIRSAVINNSSAVPQYGEIQNVGDQGGDFIFIRK